MSIIIAADDIQMGVILNDENKLVCAVCNAYMKVGIDHNVQHCLRELYERVKKLEAESKCSCGAKK